MMEAEMYGMMPIANTVNRDGPRPKHIEHVEGRPVWDDWNNFASSAGLMRNRNVRTDAVNDQRTDQKPDAFFRSPNLLVFAASEGLII